MDFYHLCEYLLVDMVETLDCDIALPPEDNLERVEVMDDINNNILGVVFYHLALRIVPHPILSSYTYNKYSQSKRDP